MLPKIFRFATQRWIVISGLLIGLFSVILFIVSPSVLIIICQNDIYSSTYSVCTNQYKTIFQNLPIPLALLAIILILPYLFRSTKSRKELRYLVLGYIVFLVIVLLPLSTQEYCLGFLGCSSMTPFAIALACVVLVAILVASTIIDLFLKPKKLINKILALLVTTFILVWGAQYILAAPDNLKGSDFVLNYDLEDLAERKNDIGICSRTFIHRHKDKCISHYAIIKAEINSCEAIDAPDIKEECIALVVRNKAINALDLELCNQITLQSQIAVCKLRINEELARKR